MRVLVAVVGCSLFVVGCGGGGGGGAPDTPAPPPTASFGLGSSTAPTTLPVLVRNDTGRSATLFAVGASGPFSVGDGALPVPVADGADATVPVVVTPTASGPLSGAVVV